MLDYIARPLGMFLKFIYDTIAFQNYGLAIIVFTVIVRAAMLPLTLKQYKSTSKMQEIQPLINDIQKRYKDDKEKMNQELMKIYKEHNYNPMGGCFPMLIQMPIILSLYWVIVQPLKFMLGKDEVTQIPRLVEVASQALGKTVQQMGSQKELLAMSYFNENPDALSKVTGLLDKSELIDFNNFLGLHLGEIPKFNPSEIFTAPGIYIPLFILVILATVTTFFSTKLSMPKAKPDAQKGGAAGCSNNSMMYMGPAMTLYFGFMMPAGVILYWMIGYVVGIAQQLYINNHIKKIKVAPAKVVDSNLSEGTVNALEAGAGEGTGDAASAEAGEGNTAGSADNQTQSASNKPKNSPGGGKKGGQKGGQKGGKKGGKKK